MRILTIGDIVGRSGRRALKELLPSIIAEKEVDFVVANGENAAGGSGLTSAVVEELLGWGADAITSGDHIWKNKGVYEIIDEESRLIRPENYPQGCPGRGWVFFKEKGVGVINVMGRVFMGQSDCPFRAAYNAVEELRSLTRVIIVDFHAEATSEKVALSRYLDGRVSAVVGTHTHVQTSDERILAGGTAAITDLGMTGPHDSVIGVKEEQVIKRFLSCQPLRFEVAKGDVRLSIGSFHGKPTAVIYRPAAPGAGKNNTKTFSSGVVEEYTVDSVEVITDARIEVKTHAKGYVVEAAIPLASLGLKIGDGLKLFGDFGVTHGDANSRDTALRTYWSNRATGIVSDEVFELKIEPRNWGELTFEK